MAKTDISTIVTAVIAKAPAWLRKDLASKDPLARQRAEEALAAMIALALGRPDSAASSGRSAD